MTVYGYIRTSRDQEPGHPGSDPHVQRRQLAWGRRGRRTHPRRTSRRRAPRTTTTATSGTPWTTSSPKATCWWLPPSTAWDGATSKPCGRSTTCSAAASGSGPWPATKWSGPSTWTPIPTRPRPSWATCWPAWRPMWPARSGRTSAAGPERDWKPPGRRAWNWAGRGVSPTSSSSPSGRDVEEGMPVAAVARKYGVPRSTLRSTLGRMGEAMKSTEPTHSESGCAIYSTRRSSDNEQPSFGNPGDG